MNDFHFIRPYWLFMLLPAFFLLIVMLKNRLKQGRWAEVCDAELLPYLLQERKVRQNRWPLIVGFIATFLVIVSLAGPTWERLPTPVFRDESALVIVLDLSRSMDAADIKPSRLIWARYKVTDILKQRKEGLTALVVYAGDAFTVTPLTEDTETIESQLSALKTEIMPSQGSNGLVAIEQALGLLRQSSLPRGDILLITDGINSHLSEQVATLIGDYRLSVLGVGTVDGAPIKVAGGGFLKDRQGNIVVPKLDSSQLSELAALGGGFYETITINDADIDVLLTAFKRPMADQTTEKSEGNLDQWDEKGPWLLLLVLPLAALFFRKGVLGVVLLLLLPFPQESQALDWPSLWKTAEQQGQQAFNRQQYEAAAEKFQSPEWKAAAQYKTEDYQQAAKTLESVDTAEGHYNRGNALAKSGQLEAAKEAYQKALKLAPDDEDAQHNKKQVEAALKTQQESKQDESDNKGEEKSDQESEEENKSKDKGGSQGQDGEQQPPEEDEDQNSDEPSQGNEESQQDEKSANKAEEQQQQKKAVDEDRQKSEAQKGQQSDQETESEQQAERQQEMSEAEQANEQWLKRIPDDPAGLLKRKFRYQYGRRRGNQVEQEQAW